MRNRIGYQNVALMTGPSPAYQAHSGIALGPNNGLLEGEISSKLKVLNTVQTASFDMAMNRADVKQISSKDNLLVARQPITQPSVSLSFSYNLTDGRNEQALGFHASGDTSFLSGVTGNDDRNFFLFIREKAEQDFNLISGYENLGLLSFGNCYANNYSLNASVGEIPNVSLTYSASNVRFDQVTSGLSGYYRPPSASARDIVASGVIPAVDRENGVVASDMTNYGYIVKRGQVLDGGVFNSGNIHFLKPGSMELFLSNPNIGGVNLSGSTKMHVQDVSINIPINRTDLMGFGSKYVYDRKAEYPSLAQLNISAIATDIKQGATDNIFSKDDVYQMEIIFNTTNSSAVKTPAVATKIQNAKIQSESISQSIGGNMTFDASFTFECTPTTGFLFSGVGYDYNLLFL